MIWWRQCIFCLRQGQKTRNPKIIDSKVPFHGWGDGFVPFVGNKNKVMNHHPEAAKSYLASEQLSESPQARWAKLLEARHGFSVGTFPVVLMRPVAKGGDFGGKAQGIVAYKFHGGYRAETHKNPTSGVMNAGDYWDYFATKVMKWGTRTKNLRKPNDTQKRACQGCFTNP